MSKNPKDLRGLLQRIAGFLRTERRMNLEDIARDVHRDRRTVRRWLKEASNAS